MSFSEKNRAFGVNAKNQLISNLKNTLWGWKKLAARSCSDPVVQTNKKLFPFEVIEGPNGTAAVKVCEILMYILCMLYLLM